MTTTPAEKQAFTEARLAGKTKKQAALIAKPGISDKSAAVIGHRLSKDTDVTEALLSTLEDLGLDYAAVLTPVKEALQATKLIVHGKNSEEGWTEEVPDWSARLKAADMAIKIVLTKKPPEKTYDKLPPEVLDSIKKNVATGNISELQRIVFKTGEHS